jgi:hypothetical protein
MIGASLKPGKQLKETLPCSSDSAFRVQQSTSIIITIIMMMFPGSSAGQRCEEQRISTHLNEAGLRVDDLDEGALEELVAIEGKVCSRHRHKAAVSRSFLSRLMTSSFPSTGICRGRPSVFCLELAFSTSLHFHM